MKRTWVERDAVAKAIEEEFSDVYCDSCRHELFDDACEYCHRKSMNWGVSENAIYRVLSKLETLEYDDGNDRD